MCIRDRNAIALKLNIERDSIFNKSIYFQDFTDMCKINVLDEIPENSRIITSDAIRRR